MSSIIRLPMPVCHKDTSTQVQSGFGIYVYIKTTDSFVADGYGTLILPAGTYPNVLRIHRTSVQSDSFNILGNPYVSTYQTQSYEWYNTAGFHNPLLALVYDTAGTGGPYISNAEYYTALPGLGIPGTALNNASLSVYPNPASGIINVDFALADNKNTTITLTDLTGRVVNFANCDNMGAGKHTVTFPTSALAPGMYMVRLQSNDGCATVKVVIEE